MKRRFNAIEDDFIIKWRTDKDSGFLSQFLHSSDIYELADDIRKDMRQQTFEDYLQQLHSSQYTGADDDMPDDFERWLEKFDVNDILELVKEYEKPR